jgi:hypothetical protein
VFTVHCAIFLGSVEACAKAAAVNGEKLLKHVLKITILDLLDKLKFDFI